MPIPRVEYFRGDGLTTSFVTKGPVDEGTDMVFVGGPIMSREGYDIGPDRQAFDFDLAPQSGISIAICYSEADS